MVLCHILYLYFLTKFHTHDLLDPREMLVGFSVLLSPSDYCINLEFE
jgi:hypothetical protein